jgi:hypothetical protein
VRIMERYFSLNPDPDRLLDLVRSVQLAMGPAGVGIIEYAYSAARGFVPDFSQRRFLPTLGPPKS